MSEIVPNLYLGNLWNATSVKQLNKNNITHIYSVIDLFVPVVNS